MYPRYVPTRREILQETLPELPPARIRPPLDDDPGDRVDDPDHSVAEALSTPAALAAFERWRAGIPRAFLRWLDDTAERIDHIIDLHVPERRPPFPCDRDRQARHDERAVRRDELFLDLWERRARHRLLQPRMIADAVDGACGDHIACLARGLREGNVRGLATELRRTWFKGNSFDGNLSWVVPAPMEGRPVAYGMPAIVLSACGDLMRRHGHLDEAYAAISWGRTARGIQQSKLLPADFEFDFTPGGWCFPIPILHRRPDWRCPYDDLAEPFPADAVDWSAWDFVVGAGKTISHDVLARLGVPEEKRVVVEVHRHSPTIPSGPLPHLHGRVVVVDDVFEGATSLTLAHVYGASVVNCCGNSNRMGQESLFRPVANIAFRNWIRYISPEATWREKPPTQWWEEAPQAPEPPKPRKKRGKKVLWPWQERIAKLRKKKHRLRRKEQRRRRREKKGQLAGKTQGQGGDDGCDANTQAGRSPPGLSLRPTHPHPTTRSSTSSGVSRLP